MNPFDHGRGWLVWLFVVAVVPRALVFVAGPWHEPERARQADSERYFVLAENLVRYRTFGKAEEEGIGHRALERVRVANGTLPPADADGLRPESFRTPGYPVFIAAANALWHDRRCVLLLQILLGALMAPVTALLVMHASGNHWAAIVAGMTWALHPALVTHDNLWLSESLFNAVCLTGVLVAAQSTASASGAVSGILIGLGGLVRPLGLLYLPLALAFAWKRGTSRRALALLLMLALVPSALWAWRNHTVGEGFRVSTVGDHNWFFYALPFTLAEERGAPWGELEGADALADALRARVRPGEDVSSAARTMAFKQVLERPGTLAVVHLKSWARLLFSHSAGTLAHLLGASYTPSGWFSELVLREGGRTGTPPTMSAAVAVTWGVLNVILAIAALAGVVAAIRSNHLVGLAAALTVALFMAATGVVGLERLRLPMIAPMLILAALVWPARRR